MSAPADWKISVPAAPVMDWPAAWQYIREQHPDPAEHHPSCSWVQTNRALLCDCDVLWDEYVRRGGDDPRASSGGAADKPTPIEYECDHGGRFYARYANGEVLPTGVTIRAFAGKSHITPKRYAEIIPAAGAAPAVSAGPAADRPGSEQA